MFFNWLSKEDKKDNRKRDRDGGSNLIPTNTDYSSMGWSLTSIHSGGSSFSSDGGSFGGGGASSSYDCGGGDCGGGGGGD